MANKHERRNGGRTEGLEGQETSSATEIEEVQATAPAMANEPMRKYYIVCAQCDKIIPLGEKMVSVSVSLETENRDGSIEVHESAAISTLCMPCANFAIVKEAFKENPEWMDLPHDATVWPAFGEVEEE